MEDPKDRTFAPRPPARPSAPLGIALGCLAAFLLVTSLPVNQVLNAWGLSAEGAREAHAALLAVLSGAMVAVWGQPGRQPWVLFGIAAVACLAAGAAGIPFMPWELANAGAHLAWCTFTGLAEELLFCGVLLPSLTAASGQRQGMLATATLFAACHATTTLPLGWMLARMLFAGAFSLGMQELYRRTQRLWAPVLCHAIFDTLFFALTQ